VAVNDSKLKGETMDLKHGSPFMKMSNNASSKDYLVTCRFQPSDYHSRCRHKKGETHLNSAKHDVNIFKLMTSNITQFGPHCKLLFPIQDLAAILMYLIWKLNAFPKSHVIGDDCNPNTARFDFLTGLEALCPL
jgi:L-lactate dehydrogenase